MSRKSLRELAADRGKVLIFSLSAIDLVDPEEAVARVATGKWRTEAPEQICEYEIRNGSAVIISRKVYWPDEPRSAAYFSAVAAT
jgi:hypothetical protein